MAPGVSESSSISIRSTMGQPSVSTAVTVRPKRVARWLPAT